LTFLGVISKVGGHEQNLTACNNRILQFKKLLIEMTRIGRSFKHKRDVPKGQNRRVVTYNSDRPPSIMVRDYYYGTIIMVNLTLLRTKNDLNFDFGECFFNFSQLFDLQMTTKPQIDPIKPLVHITDLT